MRQEQQRQFVIIFSVIIAIIILTLGLVLGLKRTPNEKDLSRYKNCVEIQSSPNKKDNLKKFNDGVCHRSIEDNRKFGLNTEECGYDGGDCIDFNERYVDCVPGTHPSKLHDLGKDRCKSKFNTKECGYDDGKCNTFNERYPKCKGDPFLVGDGLCHPDGEENTELCGWDGKDCLLLGFPSCKGVNPREFNNSICNYNLNRPECDNDGSDCDEFNVLYPDCLAKPENIGNGKCDFDGKENTEWCGWDGGDCLIPGLRNCLGINPEDYNNTICNNELNRRSCNFDGNDCVKINTYPNCKGDYNKVGDGVCHPTGRENTEECGWDGGDCIMPRYPDCKGIDPMKFNDNKCHKDLNTPGCDFDGGDCTDFNAVYPFCNAPEPFRVGDNKCDDDDEKMYNNFDCLFDGGDCIIWTMPDCRGIDPDKYKDGNCDWELNNEDCDFDSPDCDEFNDKYPLCDALVPSRVGDGICDDDVGKMFNNLECDWDGGDCLIDVLPQCTGIDPQKYNNGQCNFELNNEVCNFDGRDCSNFNRLYPNCQAPEPFRVGDGICDNDVSRKFNNENCGYDGSDCINWNREYPDCTAIPSTVGGKTYDTFSLLLPIAIFVLTHL